MKTGNCRHFAQIFKRLKKIISTCPIFKVDETKCWAEVHAGVGLVGQLDLEALAVYDGSRPWWIKLVSQTSSSHSRLRKGGIRKTTTQKKDSSYIVRLQIQYEGPRIQSPTLYVPGLRQPILLSVNCKRMTDKKKGSQNTNRLQIQYGGQRMQSPTLYVPGLRQPIL
jgi:hypothetical protein